MRLILEIIEMVRVKRLELSHLSIPEPKSGASTNSAKPALHFDFSEKKDGRDKRI